MENELPKRKTTRLKDFDYSTSGAYFVTVCTQDRMPILSEIVTTNDTDNKTTCEHSLSMVGEGLCCEDFFENPRKCPWGTPPVSQRHVHPTFQTELKPCGKIAEEQLNLLSNRYPNVRINDYIIMPDHIHAIIFLHNQTGGASPSPTLNDVVCAFKSLTSRICKQNFGIERMFQRSFMDHVIRDREDYETRRKYIYENPLRWYYKKIKEYTDSN